MQKQEQSNEQPMPHDQHLETFSLLWLRGNTTENGRNQRDQQRLRATINHSKVFDSMNDCQGYIEASSVDDRFVLIVNDEFSRELVPVVHGLRQVSSVYVLCTRASKRTQWSQAFVKIRALTDQFEEILAQIEVDQKIRMRVEEPLPIRRFSSQDETKSSRAALDDSTVQFQILVDVLLRIRSNREDIDELFRVCRKEYKGNKSHLARLREFEHNYTASAALQWYCNRLFLQKILNKAFQTENVDVLYLFRPFIRDLCHQLRRNQCRSPVRSYKGHLMPKSEVAILAKSVGRLVSVNSFPLTRLDREAVSYDLDETTPATSMNKVLFEIDADPRSDVLTPFAKIDGHEQRLDGNDVLFMVGSIFRLVGMHYDTNKKCVVRLTLCNGNEPAVKQLFESIRDEYGDEETNLLELGLVLRDMGKVDLAEKYLCRLLKQLPANDPLLDALYPSLGLVAKDKGDYDNCLHWYHRALKVYRVTRPSDYLTIGHTCNTIGMIYHAYKCQCETALDYFNKAVLLFKQFDAETDPMMARFYDSLGAVYEEQSNYSQALAFYQKSFYIKKKSLPSNHVDLSISYKNMAVANGYLRSYDAALDFYKKALEIQVKQFPLQHPAIALTYANMAAVYDAKGRPQQALTYWSKAIDMFRSTLLPEQPLVTKLEDEIRRASRKIANTAIVKKTGRKSESRQLDVSFRDEEPNEEYCVFSQRKLVGS